MNDKIENVRRYSTLHRVFVTRFPAESLFIFHLESRFLREKNIREAPVFRDISRNLSYM